MSRAYSALVPPLRPDFLFEDAEVYPVVEDMCFQPLGQSLDDLLPTNRVLARNVGVIANRRNKAWHI